MAIAKIQAKGDSHLDQGNESRDVEKWSDSVSKSFLDPKPGDQ